MKEQNIFVEGRKNITPKHCEIFCRVSVSRGQVLDNFNQIVHSYNWDHILSQNKSYLGPIRPHLGLFKGDSM